MKSRILAAAVLLLLLPALAGGATIGSVRIEGTGTLSREVGARFFGLREGDEWSAGAESSAVARLLEAYGARGMLAAEATVRVSEDPEGVVHLEIEIREGPVRPLARVGIEGIESVPLDEARGRFDTRPGRILEPRLLEEDADRLLRGYARRGRPFARLLVTGVTEEDDGIGLDLRVVEGPFLTLGDIKIAGNRRTKPATLRRLSGLRFGEPYDQDAVDGSRQRLLRSGLFRIVSEPAARIDWKEKTAVVEMEVEEARTNRVAGVLGYAPGAKGEDGAFTGYADVEFRNILGTARSGGARWERISPESRHVRLFYREPWLLGGPFALGGRVEQTLRDSTFSRVSGVLESDVDLSRRVSASFTIAGESMKPRSDRTAVPRSTRTTGGVGFRFEGRDFPANPRSGLGLHLGAEYGERKTEEDPDRGIAGNRIRQATLDGGFAIYRALGRVAVLALEAEGIGRFTDAPYVPAYDQFYLGGARTLRGYDEDRFRGSRLAWSRFEYRYLLGALSRVFLFVDTGYVFARREEGGDVVRDEFIRTGYGFGLRVDSRAGIIGIDYGLGKGDSFGNGKIHVSAEGSF
ncbi:MAG: POTRA domain-containing protein [Candidatus Eisenbacteria bacterium]